MKYFLWCLFPVLILAGVLAGGGCSSNDAAPKTKCKPGQSYFCKCADLSDGEKVCKADGENFEACMQGDVICPEAEPPPDGGEPDDGIVGGVEACPGKAVALDTTKDVILNGDTSGGNLTQKGSAGCEVAEGPENVYAVTPATDGKLTAKVQGLGDATAYARSGDCLTGAQLACSEATAVGAAETITFDVKAGQTYWVFADGKGTEGQKYSLTLHLQPPPKCNDGHVDDGEACDDGDQTDDNGCNKLCQPAGDALALGACPGVAVHVWNSPVTFTGSTTNMSAKFTNNEPAPINCGATGFTGFDRAYAVTAHKTGTMTVTTSATNFKNMVYARNTCPDDNLNDDLECGQASNTNGVTITFPVTTGKTYYVIVDGPNATEKGTFTMNLSIQ